MANAVLTAARNQRQKCQDKIDGLLELATTEERSLTTEEFGEFTDAEKRAKELDEQIVALTENESRTTAAAAAQAELEQDVERQERAAVVTDEPQTYARHSTNSYFRDMAAIAGQALDPSLGFAADQARERLRQHAKEVEIEARSDKKLAATLNELRMTPASMRAGAGSFEERVNPNTTAGTGGEFVPPLWKVADYAPYQRAGRVIANRIGSQPLPPGVDVINWPIISTGSLVGIQAANAAPVASQDIVTTSVSANVNTIAGQEDISMQLLEQSPLSMDGVIFDDLSRDYDMQLDRQVIYGTGSNGQHKGVLSVTAATANSTTAFNTDRTKANAVTCASVLFWDGSGVAAGTTPSPISFTQYRSIVNATTNIELLRFGSPTAIWAHPRRVNSWAVASDGTIGRPLYTQYEGFNNLGHQESEPVVQGVAGSLYGLPVVKDPNIPITCATGSTTSGTGDVITLVKEDDLLLFEGAVRMRALPEILSGTLQIRFQLYAYSAFLPNRFAASISIITGTTGLAAPSW